MLHLHISFWYCADRGAVCAARHVSIEQVNFQRSHSLSVADVVCFPCGWSLQVQEKQQEPTQLKYILPTKCCSCVGNHHLNACFGHYDYVS